MLSQAQAEVTGEYVSLFGEEYFRIANSHLMPDFFMSIVGADDHWMFVSSRGAITAGRRDPDLALFPYAADDQVSVAQSMTGPTTLVSDSSQSSVWEPISALATSNSVRRNLYKTPLGNKLVFEEIDETRQLAFRYRWSFSGQFGFVRSCQLENLSSDSRSLQLLDGLRNVLPYGVGSDFMMRFSNLANAYKKSELISECNLGLFYLSSIPTDRAEPSEGLKTTVVWQAGLTAAATVLSDEQLPAFREGKLLQTEDDIRGKAGAYLVSQTIELEGRESVSWLVVADVAQDHSRVIQRTEWLKDQSGVLEEVEADIKKGEQAFRRIVGSADGLQCSENKRRANRHLSNTVFNVMRGGIPVDNYYVVGADFVRHVGKFNKETQKRHQQLMDELPERLTLSDLKSRIEQTGDVDLARLAMEYLPLAFSRRHGDPTRPWNRFSIDLRTDDGSTKLNYQGNWRDIFQNWEALAFSFPELTEGMICRFVNATTADGYNPYRLTTDGFEWEEPTPEDPWANIGYWGDHQIIYLLKLLEWSRRLTPKVLDQWLDQASFTHANIPYRIKDFSGIRRDPRDTIDFDHEMSATITERVANLGADGKLLQNSRGEIHHVSLLEKILTLSLAKVSNFIPDGGIWLNTQRPEWNDANNALVGNGLSMVTTCYLYRWFVFLEDWIAATASDSFDVSEEVATFFDAILSALRVYASSLRQRLDAATRADVVTALSQAGSEFRSKLYNSGVDGRRTPLSREACIEFFATSRLALHTTIKNNRRDDGLYHAYNLLDWRQDGVHIEHLYEMLEGQVAVLSSGLLPADEVAGLLDALRGSALYRENQNSYLLYPDRQLSRFLDKNNIPKESLGNRLLSRLLDAGDARIVRRDVRGEVHFHGDFRNAAELRNALANLGDEFVGDVEAYGSEVCRLYEEMFEHRKFTGRSGTFFAYEGLGSIYWHMVSKLGLAVSENVLWARETGADEATIDALRSHLSSIHAGIGAEKNPLEYGAFPTDPYSHTPENAGVKQPGMTGQVKEDVLTRFAELGVRIEDGCVSFDAEMFDRRELLTQEASFQYCDLQGQPQTVNVAKREFAFTLCQVPIVYRAGGSDSLQLCFQNGDSETMDGLRVPESVSRMLFARTGQVIKIVCEFALL